MRFKSCFGASAEQVANLWKRIIAHGPVVAGGKAKHLLWALVFLKVYSTVEIHCSIVGWPSPKTFQQWSWYFVERIAELKNDLISLLEGQFKLIPSYAWMEQQTALYLSLILGQKRCIPTNSMDQHSSMK